MLKSSPESELVGCGQKCTHSEHRTAKARKMAGILSLTWEAQV